MVQGTKKILVLRPGSKNGRGRDRTADLTDVNPVDGDHDRDVILLVVESFNNKRLC
jgi:hypothetical protein